MGTPVPSIDGYSLSGTGDGGSGTTFREAISPDTLPDGGSLRGAAGLGGPLDALGGQPHPGQVLQQPGGPRERPRGRGPVVHRGQAR